VTAERLQKLIAAGGIASRRAAEKLITLGRVTVNGVPVTELGARADPVSDDIRVDGHRLEIPLAFTYLALHKPAGVVTTAADERGRRSVIDLLPPGLPRLFPVGRLDRDSEGLLLLTDDGDLALRLTHPRHEVEKEYLAFAERPLADESLARLRSGVEVDGRATAPAIVEPVKGRVASDAGTSPPTLDSRLSTLDSRPVWYRVVLREGRKRQIRRMFATEGIRVLRLVRIRIGPIRLAGLEAGKTRRLTAVEMRELQVQG